MLSERKTNLKRPNLTSANPAFGILLFQHTSKKYCFFVTLTQQKNQRRSNKEDADQTSTVAVLP